MNRKVRVPSRLALGLLLLPLPLPGLAAPAAAAAPTILPSPSLAAGQESTVVFPDAGGELKIYMPLDFKPDRQWPVLFFYHGQGGVPTTLIMRLFTENKDYIVIGMAYLPAPPAGPGGGITPEQQKDHIARELAAYRRVRDWAVAHAHADPNRLFLSGGSKGGWTVSYLADQEIGRLAGLVIALSGRQRTALNPPPAGAYRDKPVYIGVGETDGNLLPALQARSVYARFGARVSFEEYAGVGHQVPQKAERLSLWLRAHGHYAHPWTPDSERAQLKETFRAEYQAAMAEKDAARRQARLLAIAEDPRLPLCGDSVYRGVLAQLDSVRQDPANRDAWNAEASFDRLCWQEWNIRFLNDMKAVCEGFQQVSQRYRDTLYGKRAGKFYERVAPVYAKMQEDVKKATEEAAKKAPPKKNIAVDFPGVSFGR